MKQAFGIRLLSFVLWLFCPCTAFALGVTGGDVPLPVKTVGGVQQVSWDGTYAELLAADALAACWTTQQDRYYGMNGGPPDSLAYPLLAKMAAGIADDLATTLLLATDKPVVVAPAMNVRMWQHAATQRNVAQLKADGVKVIDPKAKITLHPGQILRLDRKRAVRID